MSQRDVRLDFNLLKILDAIYTHGGITGAARALHLTQPAITHSLNRLRELLGDPLFVRQGNRMVATHRTRAIMPKIQLHLNGLQAAVSMEEAFDPAGLDLVFTVGFRDVLESIAFPLLVARLAEEAPRAKVLSRPVVRSEVERQLNSGAVDLVVDRRLQAMARVRSAYLCDDSLVVVMSDRHPLASDPLQRRDYLSARHVAVSQESGSEALDALLREDGKTRDIGLVCQHYFAAAEVAASSDWLLTVPGFYAQRLSRVLPVVVRPLPIRLKAMRIEMYWHESRDNDPAQSWFRELIASISRQAAGQLQ
ncbi:LysR family transcriptional regulator [Noviherbaspirillum massiliense]|uniref:LysR family transcriptional regulator n=1 Tax=Noviherbaspirillum massiliense TaxID=1465823 RepID=UPI00036137DF|nr:LysR family transcriptional regulator [Noviherbaspirillum massiliense]